MSANKQRIDEQLRQSTAYFNVNSQLILPIIPLLVHAAVELVVVIGGLFSLASPQEQILKGKKR